MLYVLIKKQERPENNAEILKSGSVSRQRIPIGMPGGLSFPPKRILPNLARDWPIAALLFVLFATLGSILDSLASFSLQDGATE